MAALPLRTNDAPSPRRRAARPATRRAAPDRADRRSSGRQASHPRHLRVVPARRRTAGFVFVAAIVLAGLMLGAAVLNTTLAERQVQVDALERRVDEANARFEVLRGQRAELRSPGRLSAEAAALGMFPASGGTFIRVDPQTYAEVLASFGSVEEAKRIVDELKPLDQFRTVKRASAGGTR